jgi:hypothetical protein
MRSSLASPLVQQSDLVFLAMHTPVCVLTARARGKMLDLLVAGYWEGSPEYAQLLASASSST